MDFIKLIDLRNKQANNEFVTKHKPDLVIVNTIEEVVHEAANGGTIN